MTKKEIIQIGKDVLQAEGIAVETLSRSLGPSFADAVDLLSKTPSRVIVTGIGKSGLIGRKIAATLASCGTPAIFIHPAEAGHGDLGMIIKKDIVLAISYSGETKEIVHLLDFIKRIGIHLICITGNRRSKIAAYSDIVLEAKVEKEAEPSDLVPTSSSTAALAMGDALAIALMKKKGFGEDEFASVHPRGQLGKKLLKVRSLMHKGIQIPSVSEDASLKEVLTEMTIKKLGMTCVLDDQKRLIGIITDGDLRRALQKHKDQLFIKKAVECMTPDPVTIKKDDLATEALKLMEENKITSLVVTDQTSRIQGIIHLHDLWRTEMF